MKEALTPMNHRHRKVLHQLFSHPINPNIHFRDIETIFGELGADVSHSGNGKLHVALNGHTANFQNPGKSMPKEEVIQVRKFIETCGIEPERDYPL
jgi:hypothetical protein